MEQNVNKLIECIKNLTSDAVNRLLSLALGMLAAETSAVTECPYCGSTHIVRNGKKCGKQRYLCRCCGRTFVTTTHTVMSMSHYPASVWKEVVADTMDGCSIDHTVERMKLSHQCVFNMRHKLLLAMQDMLSSSPVVLGKVSELDETYVLENLKGKKLPEGAGRPARKHGAKAQKRGLSDEYICINTGIQRDGGAIAEAVNRAKPDSGELLEVYKGHLEDGTLLLCDGLKSYRVLRDLAECVIKDINTASPAEVNFFHLNTVNNFHSFIKDRYDYYRGVATKYLNRYNALFSLAWRRNTAVVTDLYSKLFHQGTADYYHSIKDIKTLRLLAL